MTINKDKNTQVLVTMPWELKEQIEDYQFKQRIPNRTSAILELIQKGLESKENKEPSE